MLELIELDKDTAITLREQWSSQLDSIADDVGDAYLYGSYDRLCDWFEKCAQDKDTLFCLNIDGNLKAVSEILDASKGKDPSHKFLNVYLEPNLNIEWRETLDRDIIGEVINTLTAVIVGAVKLSNHYGTNKLKIYGRTEEMIGLFDAMLSQSNPPENINIYKQGKWLIIES